MVPKYNYREVQTHKKEKKNALTEERKTTVENDAGNIEEQPRIRRKRHEAQVSSRQIDKTGEGNRLGRHGSHVGHTEEDQSNSKLPLRVKPLPSDLPQQKDFEKRLQKSQVWRNVFSKLCLLNLIIHSAI